MILSLSFLFLFSFPPGEWKVKENALMNDFASAVEPCAHVNDSHLIKNYLITFLALISGAPRSPPCV